MAEEAGLLGYQTHCSPFFCSAKLAEKKWEIQLFSIYY